MARPKKHKSTYTGIKGHLVHGRPVEFIVVDDDPAFYERIHKRKTRVLYTLHGLFYLFYAGITADIFYQQVFTQEVNKLIYML